MVREIMIRMKPLIEQKINANVFLKHGTDDAIVVYLYFKRYPKIIVTIYNATDRIFEGQTSEHLSNIVVTQTRAQIMGEIFK